MMRAIYTGRKVCFHTVSYATAKRKMFLDGCQLLPVFRRIITGSLVLVVSNLIGAIMSSEISLMPFEDFFMEAKHACVFVIMLGGMRGGRCVLAKLSLMMLPDDTLKSSHLRLKPRGTILQHPLSL